MGALLTARSVLLLLLIWLLQAAGVAHAIDKGDLKDVPTDVKDRVFGAFTAVPVYYLVTEGGGGLVQRFDPPHPAFRVPMGFVIVLYLDPQAAEEYRRIAEQKDRRRYVIRSSPLDRILLAQYSAIGRPPSDNLEAPDFVVLERLGGLPVVFLEFLMDERSKAPYVASAGGRRFIPAFVSRQEAIEFQQRMEKQTGRAFTRVGQDFRRFLRFVGEHAASETPVAVFGYGRGSGSR